MSNNEYALKSSLKTWKLVSGILSIVCTFIVMFQSCAAGLVNSIEDKGSTSGSSGMMVSFIMLVGGIVSICVRNSLGKGAHIARIIIFGLAALVGFSGAGNYSDLNIWAGWCALNAVLAVVAMVKNGKKMNAQ